MFLAISNKGPDVTRSRYSIPTGPNPNTGELQGQSVPRFLVSNIGPILEIIR